MVPEWAIGLFFVIPYGLNLPVAKLFLLIWGEAHVGRLSPSHRFFPLLILFCAFFLDDGAAPYHLPDFKGALPDRATA